VIQTTVSEASGLSSLTWNRSQRKIHYARKREVRCLSPTLSFDASPLPPPEVVKMDIEGREAAALKGAQRTPGLHRPIVFVALPAHEQKRKCVRPASNALNTEFTISKGVSISDDSGCDEVTPYRRRDHPFLSQCEQ
jgi:hypothetical protein